MKPASALLSESLDKRRSIMQLLTVFAALALVLAPKGTVLPVLGRRGEWVQVAISPALRKTGMVMRWYKNEDNGWIHDSLLEIVQPAQP